MRIYNLLFSKRNFIAKKKKREQKNNYRNKQQSFQNRCYEIAREYAEKETEAQKV